MVPQDELFSIAPEIPVAPEKPVVQVEAFTQKSPMRKGTNEDSFLTGPNYFILCDGAGGPEKGEEASKIATKILQSYINDVHQRVEVGYAVTESDITDIFNKMFGRAHYRIESKLNLQRERGESAFTTASVGILAKEQRGGYLLLFANAGDSPIAVYNPKKKQFAQLSIDHGSFLMDISKNNEKELRHLQESLGRANSPQELPYPQNIIWKNKNIVEKLIGSKDAEKKEYTPYVGVYKLEPGERVIAYTDGLNALTWDEIASILGKNKNNKKAARKLVEAAQKRMREGKHPRVVSFLYESKGRTTKHIHSDDTTVIIFDTPKK